jgi:hypothetical protein
MPASCRMASNGPNFSVERPCWGFRVRFCPDDGQLLPNPVNEGLPTIREFSHGTAPSTVVCHSPTLACVYLRSYPGL